MFCFHLHIGKMANKQFRLLLCVLSIELLHGSILVPPKLNQLINQKLLDEGANFQMWCSIEKGTEPYSFEWSKNGIAIRQSPDVKYRIENLKILSVMTIEKVARSDAGNYSCLVKNAVGSDGQSVLLNVKGNLSKFNLIIKIIVQSVAQCYPLVQAKIHPLLVACGHLYLYYGIQIIASDN